MTIDSRPSIAAAMAQQQAATLGVAYEAKAPPGWEARNIAVQKSEDKLREAMKLIEQAHQRVRDAEELIIPYMGLITHRIACNVFSHAIDSVLSEHRRAVNVLIEHDRPVAIGAAPEHHI